ncbi:MAG: hypothetical protein C0412_04615 [Flavobacterium sp.]|nr:hypothetical protein [Flavobacterium sp.]
MKIKIRLLRILLFFVCFIFVLFTTPFIHESGHALIPILKGGGIKEMAVFPIQIYPDFGKKVFYHSIGAYTLPDWPKDKTITQFDEGLMHFSGGGLTLFIASAAILLLWYLKPKKFFKIFLLVYAFEFIDIFRYCYLPLISPTIFTKAEPIEGLMEMGLSKFFAYLIVTLCSGTILYFIIKYIKKNPFPKVSLF